MKSGINTLLASIALALSSSVMAQTIALQNVNLIDVEALSVNKAQTIIIEDDKIKQIVPANSRRFADDVIKIDLAGKYVIPGLIDTHVHHATSPDDSDNDEITRIRLRQLLQGGVTSVRDMGGDTRALSSLKRRADNDIIQSPDIYYSVIIGGKAFFSDPRTVASAKGEIPGAVDWMRAVDEHSDFDAIMLRSKGLGATGIKIYANVPGTVVAKLSQAAKKHDLKVWSHAFIGPATPLEAVNGGVETISHAADFAAQVIENFYDMRRKNVALTEQQKSDAKQLEAYQTLIKQMKNKGTILDSTLTVFDKTKASRGEKGLLLNEWGGLFTQLAHQAGVTIAAGTDVTSDRFNTVTPMVHHEMKLLVERAGLTPLEALQAATINGAKVIGIEKQTGSIKAGKTANLVVLNSDPSIKISNSQNIVHVIKNGQFIHLGDNEKLPFVMAREAAGLLFLSGQLGNLPTTMALAGNDISTQMTQAMKNIGFVLQDHNLDFNDVVKCTLMLADIKDWPLANQAYTPFFTKLPARSAFAASGLALGAKVEVECIAAL